MDGQRQLEGEMSARHGKADEDRYRRIFRQVQTGIFVLDPDGKVLLANESARSSLGLDLAEGENLTERFPEVARLLGQDAETGKRPVIVELGKEAARTVEFSLQGVIEGGDRIIFAQDVASERGRENRLDRIRQLSVAGKMAARLSHEIRNPLSGVFAGLRTLEREAALSGDNRFMLQLVLDEMRSLDRILRRLTNATRTDVASAAQISVGDLLERTVESLWEIASVRGVTLKILSGLQECQIAGDEKSLGRVLANLLENALEASQSGEVIRVGWRELSRAEQAARVPGFKGAVVGIFGEDSGRGISADLSLSSVFRPFEKKKASVTGIGLAFAQEIIEIHGGTFSLEKLPGGGTSFEILMPSAAPGMPDHLERALECACRNREEHNKGSEQGAGIEPLCWVKRGLEERAATGAWPEMCRRCPVFRRWNLCSSAAGGAERGKEA